jgi:hypothetical protein
MNPARESMVRDFSMSRQNPRRCRGAIGPKQTIPANQATAIAGQNRPYYNRNFPYKTVFFTTENTQSKKKSAA